MNNNDDNNDDECIELPTLEECVTLEMGCISSEQLQLSVISLWQLRWQRLLNHSSYQ